MGEEAIEVAKKVKNILESRFKIDVIILYGSRVRGDWKEYSDYDMIIVSKDFEKYPFRERLKMIYDLLPPEADFDIIPLTPKEFEYLKSKPTIVREAVSYGIVL